MAKRKRKKPSEARTPPVADSDSRPNPDPTLLTTQQLERALQSMRELFEARFDELRETNTLRHRVVETRLDGMDKALTLLQKDTDRVPAQIDEKINALKEIHEEKFQSVQLQFKERDVRTEQSSKDSKVAVDAALQAAKEAVGEQNKSSALAIAKSEASTVKQIDQQAILIGQVSKAGDDKISDIKERLTRIEGKDEGSVKAVAVQRDSTNNVAAVAGVAVAILVGVAGLIMSIMNMKH